MVEDPIAKVRFPSFAAAATLEHEGKTLCFIDESTLREFQQRAVDFAELLMSPSKQSKRILQNPSSDTKGDFEHVRDAKTITNTA